MKINHLIILFIALFKCCYAQEEIFLQANKLYDEKKYATALELYNSIDNKGPSVWYNMGNCAYNLNDITATLLYWSRARNQATLRQHALLDHNMNVLAQRTDFSDVHSTYFNRIRFFCSSVPWLVLQLLFLCIWYVGWLAKNRRSFKSTCFFAFLLGGMSIIGGIKYTYNQEKTGFIIGTQNTLYAGPNEKFQKIGNASLLTHVAVEKIEQEWCKVRTQNTTGWLKKEMIALV